MEALVKTIFVMVKCELGAAYRVADEAVEIEQVSEVYSISGQYDLLIKVYLEDEQDIGRFVNETLHKIEGIRDTFTMIAFTAF
jgi:DNA-binding Lrp family transcriptional regulator